MGVVVDRDMRDSIVEVIRCSGRLMMVKMVWRGVKVNVISAYAPQVGLGRDEKEQFWEEFDELVGSISEDERIVVGGDLNGHVQKDSDGYNRVHGGWGYGSRNAEGEAILEAAVAQDLVVVNTMFQKKEAHLVTCEAPQGVTD